MQTNNTTIEIPPATPTEHPVFIFDGVCALCDRFVQFILKRDRRQIFQFAANQSPYAQSRLSTLHPPPPALDSVYLLEGPRCFTRSTAALRILSRLGFPWNVLGHAGLVVPRPIRDWVYQAIAKSRYRWFGKFDACKLPPKNQQHRFLDQAPP